MTKQTIETKLVDFYVPKFKKVQIPKSEYDAIYELFNSVGKGPKEFYTPDNKGRIRIQDNRIIYLKAGQIGLKSILESIGNLKNLKELYLFDNQLNSVPESFGNLENLKILNLGHNQLNEKSIEFLKELKEKGVKVIY